MQDTQRIEKLVDDHAFYIEEWKTGPSWYERGKNRERAMRVHRELEALLNETNNEQD